MYNNNANGKKNLGFSLTGDLRFWKIIQLLCTFEKMEYLCFVIEERLCLH